MSSPPPPTPDASRRFTRIDLLTLLIGGGLGAAWYWWVGVAPYGPDQGWFAPDDDWRTTWWSLNDIPPPFLVTLGAAFLVCRWRSAHPPLRDLLRQPGTTAPVALLLWAVWQGIALTTGASLGPLVERWTAPRYLGGGFATRPLLNLFTDSLVGAGPLVAILWTLQAAAGSWTSERTWLDRAGRCMGIALIGFGLQHAAISTAIMHARV